MGFLSRFLKRRPERVREPQFAGHLYPAEAEELRRQVRGYLAPGQRQAHGASIKALIVPFAQLDYVGALLGEAWAAAAASEEEIKRVVLVSSAWRIPFQGVACSGEEAWRSPLGEVWEDEVSREQLEVLELVRTLPEAHRAEPSLELQLPFLQEALGEEVSIVPLLAGDGSEEGVSRVFEALSALEQTLWVVCTEIGYGSREEEVAQLMEEVSQAIAANAAEAIGREQVSSRHPVQALLGMAKRRGWRARRLGVAYAHELRRARGEALSREDEGLSAGYGAFVFEG